MNPNSNENKPTTVPDAVAITPTTACHASSLLPTWDTPPTKATGTRRYYTDRDFSRIYRVEWDEAEPDAPMRYFHSDLYGRWVEGLGAVMPVIFNIHVVASASVVFFCPDERIASQLSQILMRESSRYAATTAPFGPDEVHRTNFAAIAHKRVVVFACNDDTGSRYADAVCALCAPLASVVTRLDLPGLPPDGTVLDFFVPGGDPNDFARVGYGTTRTRLLDTFFALVEEAIHAARQAKLERKAREREQKALEKAQEKARRAAERLALRDANRLAKLSAKSASKHPAPREAPDEVPPESDAESDAEADAPVVS